MAANETEASFPNLRRLFIEARSEDEERAVSRRAVGVPSTGEIVHIHMLIVDQFYNAVLFMGSVAVFSLVAQKMYVAR